MTTELNQALTQVRQIGTFCDFFDRLDLPLPPFPITQDPVRAAGLNRDIWHGLGIVGLWAALDAFRERRHPQAPGGKRRVGWLTSHLPQDLAAAVRELEDIRHLYAHNFGGVADDKYFRAGPQYKRYVFKQDCSHRLSSDTGSSFDGKCLTLALDDLRFYISQVEAILRHLDNVSTP